MLVHQEDMSRVLDHLRGVNMLSIDTETTGLERKDLPFAVIIADSTHEYYFDERCSGDFWRELNDRLGPHEWALQNAKFDLKMLERRGVYIQHGIVYDIATGARLLRNDHMKYSLDAQAQRYLGVPKSDKVMAYIKEHDLYDTRLDAFGVAYKSPRFDRVPLEVMHEYACLDARLTYDLHRLYKERLTADGLMDLYNMESNLVGVCLGMEEHGLLLDKQYTTEALYAEQNMAKLLKQEFEDRFGQPYVNSAKSMQKILHTQLPMTEGGNPSLTDDVIEMLITSGDAHDAKVATTVRSIRTYEKRVTTYYKSYLNFATPQSTIHPTMWQAGTRTGRFSYSDPNLQNIPKEEEPEHMHIVRACFKPRPGTRYVSFDYSQMEYRMMAAYAGATDIITAVMNGADFHQATADLLGIKRSAAKTLNFALLYGAGKDKVAQMLRVSPQEAEVLKFKYFSKLPQVERLIDNVIATGRSRGYVRTWCGRRMYADKEFCYALPNHLIQGGGADVVKKAMIEIDHTYPALPMVVQIHDQLVFEMAEEELSYIPDIKRIMESVFPPMNGMVLKVDVKISNGTLAEKDMVDYEQ